MIMVLRPAAAVSCRHILQAVAVLAIYCSFDTRLNEFRVYSVDIMILSFDIYAERGVEILNKKKNFII